MTTGTRDNSGSSEEAAAGNDTPWYERKLGVLVVAVYAALTAGGVLVSMGAGDVLAPKYTVPGYVYVFASIGVTGYVFTTLITDFDQSVSELLRAVIRVPAALPLAMGVYLLASLLGISGEPTSRLVAGLSFLTGLYANLTFKQLGSLADSLYPDEGESSGGGRR